MQNTELRIGNLVEYPGWNKDGSSAIFMVRDIFGENENIALTNGVIQIPKTKITHINPIPLNEKWLLEFNFKRFPWGLVNCGILFKDDKKRCEKLHIEMGNGYRINIETVHHLQNVFFYLTNSELIYNKKIFFDLK